MISTKEFKISSNDDVDRFKKEIGTSQRIHLDLKETKLEKTKFTDLFEKLSTIKNLNEFQIDMSHTSIDDDRTSSFVNALSSFTDLKILNLNFEKVKISESNFDKIIKSINNTRLERLYLNFNNVELTKKMRESMMSLVKDSSSLTSVSINTKSSKISKEDVERINEIMRPIKWFVHWHDFPELWPTHYCTHSCLGSTFPALF